MGNFIRNSLQLEHYLVISHHAKRLLTIIIVNLHYKVSENMFLDNIR